MFEKMIRKMLKPVIAEAYEEGYKRGADDIVHRMAFVYDISRQKGREDGMTEVGAINIEEVTVKEFDTIA